MVDHSHIVAKTIKIKDSFFQYVLIAYLRKYFVSFNTPQVLKKISFQNKIWNENTNNQPSKVKPLDVIMVLTELLNSEQNSETMTNTSLSMVLVHITKKGLLKDISEPW